MQKKEILQVIAIILFYILLLLLAFQIIMKITGHSPSVETILLTGNGVIVAFLFNLSLTVGRLAGKTDSFIEYTEKAISKLEKTQDKILENINRKQRYKIEK